MILSNDIAETRAHHAVRAGIASGLCAASADRSKTAYANFATPRSASELVVVDVFASEQVLDNSHRRTVRKVVSARVFASGARSGQSGWFMGQTEASTMKIHDDLQQAAAIATIVLSDEFGSMRTLSLNLSWRSGELVLGKTSRCAIGSTATGDRVAARDRVCACRSVAGSLLLDGIELLGAGRQPACRFVIGHLSASTRSMAATDEDD